MPDATPAAASSPCAALPIPRLLAATKALGALTALTMAGRHALWAAMGRLGDGEHNWSEILDALSPRDWQGIAAHLMTALSAFIIGGRLLHLAYPLRGLEKQAQAGNAAAAVQTGAHWLGAAVLAGACFGGLDFDSLKIGAAFFGLALLATVVLAFAHRVVTRFKDHEEVADGNLAVALASGGLHVGLAMIAARACSGEFAGWKPSLLAFCLALVWALLLWPLRQIVLARLVLRMTPKELDARLAGDKSVALGAIEGALYAVSAAALSLA